MSKDLNQCNFIGRLGGDPEQRFMPNGDGVTNFSIAVGDDYKDKNGQKVEQTEWVNCVAFRGLSDVVAKYTSKGSKVFVSGKMKTRSYEKDGVKKYSTEIVVIDFQMLDSRQDGQAPQAPARQQAPQQQAPAQSFDNFDDDIPF